MNSWLDNDRYSGWMRILTKKEKEKEKEYLFFRRNIFYEMIEKNDPNNLTKTIFDKDKDDNLFA